MLKQILILQFSCHVLHRIFLKLFVHKNCSVFKTYNDIKELNISYFNTEQS